MDHVGNAQNHMGAFSSRTFHFLPIPQCGQKTRGVLGVCASQTGWMQAQRHLEKPVFVVGQVEEDADRLKE